MILLGTVWQISMKQLLNHRHHPEGDVVDGQLLEAGPEPAASLEPADHPLDDVPLPVTRLVERLVPRLVLSRRNHPGDPAPLQPAAELRVAGALVSAQPLRPGPAATPARRPHARHHRLEG